MADPFSEVSDGGGAFSGPSIWLFYYNTLYSIGQEINKDIL